MLLVIHHAYHCDASAQVKHRPDISEAELNMARPHKYCTGRALWGASLGPSELEAPSPSRRNTTTACRVNALRASACVHAGEYVGGVPLTACLMNSNNLHECSVCLISVLCVLAKAKCEGYVKLFVFPAPSHHVTWWIALTCCSLLCVTWKLGKVYNYVAHSWIYS